MPALQEFELTEAEKIAKHQFQLYFKDAYYIPCDIDNIDVLPLWYNEEKYKRGQKYFHQNRPGILNSNLVGLICLLAEPKGLQILSSTGKSSTKEVAKKRYISTILHTLSWYEIDMTPGSESRKSLATVRKLHFAASNSAKLKNIGHITQSELALTAFGFMGLVLVRSDLMGIYSDNQEDIESFVHLWAVLCNMIGVKDEYNICLLPLDALKILCQIFIRYILIPLIQIELPEFKKMTQAMLDGLSDIMPHMDYETQMFTVKLVLGVPGYQHRIDHKNINLCRSIFNQNEINELNYFIKNIKASDYLKLSVDIPIIEIYQIDKYKNTLDSENKLNLKIQTDTNMNTNVIALSNIDMNEFEKILHIRLELKNTECVKIYYIDYENEWQNCLNNEKFNKLSSKGQRIMNLKHYGRILMDYKISRYIIDSFISFMLNRMRKEGYRTNNTTVIKSEKSIDKIE